MPLNLKKPDLIRGETSISVVRWMMIQFIVGFLTRHIPGQGASIVKVAYIAQFLPEIKPGSLVLGSVVAAWLEAYSHLSMFL